LEEGEERETREIKVIKEYLDLMRHVLLALMAYLFQAVAGDHRRYVSQNSSLRGRTVHEFIQDKTACDS
jgi:hypothetical protein